MFERCWSVTPESAAVIDRICAAARAENRAAGQRLAAIGELDVLRAREHGACERWTIDTIEAVSAEVAAALRIGQHLASDHLYHARAMRTRLPQVGAVLCAGDIDYPTFQTIVDRTDLITDEQTIAAVDTELAATVPRWPSMTRGRLRARLDKVVAAADRDAVRQRRQRQLADREVFIARSIDGIAAIDARLHSTDAHALDTRLDALAATVCPTDPRNRDQRRADALGALAAGATRLTCRCENPDCPAATGPTPTPVTIHVIADQHALTNTGTTPGSLIGADALIPPELLAELAATARLRPLHHPGHTPPEPRYTPSTALADYIRCRDLTCRFPGCDAPATRCDLDHTIAYADRGPTHATNLKALCRKHHLIKTFWGWHDQQLPDGTVIWTAPSGHTYITTPGSALLFPALCAPTGDLTAPETHHTGDHCRQRNTKMPQRRRTRTQNRATRINTERQHNRTTRQTRAQTNHGYFNLPPPDPNEEPPPF